MRKRFKLNANDFDPEDINRAYAAVIISSLEAVTLVAFPERESHSHATFKLVLAFLAYRCAPQGLRSATLAVIDSAIMDCIANQMSESGKHTFTKSVAIDKSRPPQANDPTFRRVESAQFCKAPRS